MYRNKSKGLSVFRRFGIAALSGVMVFSLGLAAACTDDDDDSETTTTSEDTQTILNGNFEYFDTGDDDAHIIYTPDSWTSSSSGNSNYVMNGIIDTSEEGWETISDPTLGSTLAYNNSLDDDDDDYDDLYVDYNDMSAIDIPYADTYNAITEDSGYYTIFTDDDGSYYIYTNEYEAVIGQDADEVADLLDGDTKQTVTANSDGTYYYTDSDGETVTVYAKTLIDNPLTHDYIFDIEESEDGTTATGVDQNGETVELWIDDDGNYYLDEDMTEEYGTHVLMIHNYVNSDYRYGNAQSYSSSTTIELDPNTAAVFSVWVKTSDLIYGRYGTAAELMDGGDDLGNLGAYISVEQTVGGTSVGSFSIEGINTYDVTENNGWVQYTVYLRGCDFASTTFTISLGLGIADDNDYTYAVEGYAFFDDIECTIYPTIDYCLDDSEVNELQTAKTYCSLEDVADDDVAFNTYSWGEYDTYYINLADYQITSVTDTSTNSTGKISVDLSNGSTVTVQLTQDDEYYVSSSGYPTNITGVNFEEDSDVYLNYGLDIDTSDDVIAAFKLSDITNGTLASQLSGTGYANTITSLFDGFTENIPDAGENTSALVILSARGAAYTATISDSNAFLLNSGEYMIVSFWVNTSDMEDFTAATINIVYEDSDGNIVSTSTLTVDTTDVQFDAGEYEDIYSGWVQCFFYVENPTDLDDVEFYLEFCFGNTTIQDTSLSDYKSGYIAIANITTFVVSEDVFDLTSTGNYAASFSFEDTDNRENNYMDTVYSAQSTDIETNISTPSSYTGVYGGSANTVYRDTIDASGYESRNSNSYAGLINQDYFIENYYDNVYTTDDGFATNNQAYAWLVYLLNNSTSFITSASLQTASDAWNAIFGYTTIQPLLIVNTIQYFESSGVYAMNYGFKASSSTTVSSSSYQAITVRVYVSNGAVAYVYLTDEDDITETLSFDLPTYSFWYDTVGNVLDSEPDYDDEDYDATDHVIYYLRSDGLYEDADGNLFANLYNYSRVYLDENIVYYDIDGNDYDIDDVDNDTIYYASKEDAEKAANGDSSAIQANHYLVAYDSDGDMTRVFYYGDPDETGEIGYYYIVTETDDDGDETISYTGTVSTFVIGSENGGADLRYDNSNNSQSLYVCIDARYDANGNLFGIEGLTDESQLTAAQIAEIDVSELGYDANGNKVGGTWTTVTFYVHTGDESKSYVLELWSGSRSVSGVDSDGNITVSGSVKGSYVAFDYSALTTDEDTYSSQLSAYENKIINSYIQLLYGAGVLTTGTIASAEENISYYESLYKTYEDEIKEFVSDNSSYVKYYNIINSYSALYYTYSLYDDQDYVPFNADTAEEGLVGYDYDIDDYEETLVYLSYSDYTASEGSVSVFLDYSATDVTVDTDEVDDEDEDEDEDESELTVWLLVTSIILAAVLIFTLISMLARDLWKKLHRKRKFGKNVYSSKRKHYIRKLKLTEDTADGMEPADGVERSNGEEK